MTNQAQRRLRALEKKLAGPSASLAAAEIICRRARELAPVDTGRLRASLTVRAEGRGAAVVCDCEYAGAVELGTSRRPPSPFLLPAARMGAGEAAQAAARSILNE